MTREEMLAKLQSAAETSTIEKFTTTLLSALILHCAQTLGPTIIDEIKKIYDKLDGKP